MMAPMFPDGGEQLPVYPNFTANRRATLTSEPVHEEPRPRRMDRGMSRLDAVAMGAFDPERLTLARQLNRLTRQSWPAGDRVTSSELSQYERGTSRPLVRHLRSSHQRRRGSRVLQ